MAELYIIYVADINTNNSFLEVDFADEHSTKDSEKILGYFNTPEQCAKILDDILDDNGFSSGYDIAVEIATELINDLYVPF